MPQIAPLPFDWEIPSSLKSKYQDHIPPYLWNEDKLRLWLFGNTGGTYTKISNSYGQFENTFNGIIRQVTNTRRRWSIGIDYNMYPLRLLFDELWKIQNSTIHTNCYKLMKVYDYCGFDFDDLNSGVTIRNVSIESVEDSGDSGAVAAGWLECQHDPDGLGIPPKLNLETPKKYYCSAFRVTIEEAEGYLL